jgi:hypothetical protein
MHYQSFLNRIALFFLKSYFPPAARVTFALGLERVVFQNQLIVLVNESRSRTCLAFLLRCALAVLPFVLFLGPTPFHAALTYSCNDFFPLTCGADLFGFLGHGYLLVPCISVFVKKTDSPFFTEYSLSWFISSRENGYA